MWIQSSRPSLPPVVALSVSSFAAPSAKAASLPAPALISAVRAAVNIQLFVIVRPRGGNFVYSDHELDVMRRDILEAKARGVDGVVLGC